MSSQLVCRCAVLLGSGLIAFHFAEGAEVKFAKSAAPIVCTAMTPADAKIIAALETPTVMEFADTPLADVVEYLKDFHHLEIQIDQRAMSDSGLARDTPVTRNLRGIPLRKALELLLKEHKLTWIIDHEVVLITTEEAAKARRETCIYNVAELLGERSTEELAQVVRQSLLTVRERDESADVSVVPFRNLLIVRHSQAGQRRVTQFLLGLQKALAEQ